jgi:hypothetical protein
MTPGAGSDLLRRDPEPLQQKNREAPEQNRHRAHLAEGEKEREPTVRGPTRSHRSSPSTPHAGHFESRSRRRNSVRPPRLRSRSAGTCALTAHRGEHGTHPVRTIPVHPHRSLHFAITLCIHHSSVGASGSAPSPWLTKWSGCGRPRLRLFGGRGGSWGPGESPESERSEPHRFLTPTRGCGCLELAPLGVVGERS